MEILMHKLLLKIVKSLFGNTIPCSIYKSNYTYIEYKTKKEISELCEVILNNNLYITEPSLESGTKDTIIKSRTKAICDNHIIVYGITAQIDNDFVAQLIVCDEYEHSTLNHTVQIYVKEEHRHKGIAVQLLNAFKRHNKNWREYTFNGKKLTY